MPSLAAALAGRPSGSHFERRPLSTPTPFPAVATARRAEDFQPRYVHLPNAHGQDAAPRNLAFGIGTLFLALLISGAAMFVVGPRALLALVACLSTFTVLYVLARLHTFRQKHGVFLALGIVCLLGALFALSERAFTGLDGVAIAPLPATKIAAPSLAPEPAPPHITEAFALTPPDPKAGPRVRALKDSRVVIEKKTFLIKAGDLFALAETRDGEVTFKVRDLRIALPAAAVEILPEPATEKIAAPPAAEPAAAIEPSAAALAAAATKGAQEEAVRRYPALGIEGSRENLIFVSTFRELKDNKASDFFKNAEWPLELAELLAKSQGWRRDDVRQPSRAFSPPSEVGLPPDDGK